ncbi:unnamed protein product, partial [Rangifer tarandus platyrhynchus]
CHLKRRSPARGACSSTPVLRTLTCPVLGPWAPSLIIVERLRRVGAASWCSRGCPGASLQQRSSLSARGLS